MSTAVPKLHLNDGTTIPAIGLGCYMGTPGGGQRAYDMCEKALKIGYRHFDTAAAYDNEKEVGDAIRASGIPREEIYIVTKLAYYDHHRVREAFEESLKKLSCDYIDLYLLHCPQASVSGADGRRFLRPDESPTFIETYKEMEKLLETGKVKSLGVSNFSIKTLSELLLHCNIVPATNQVEVHPCLPQADLKSFCEAKGILLTAYSPFGRGGIFFDHPVVTGIAVKHETTAAQVIISWSVQRNTIVIPKSENEDRLKANISLVNLTQEDMKALDEVHKESGMHKALLEHDPSGIILGWTYEELGWNMTIGGIVTPGAQ